MKRIILSTVILCSCGTLPKLSLVDIMAVPNTGCLDEICLGNAHRAFELIREWEKTQKPETLAEALRLLPGVYDDVRNALPTK